MPTRTLFLDHAGNGTSPISRVLAVPGNAGAEMILLRGWGSWSSATVRLQVSDDGSNYQNLTDEKGYAVGLFGDNFATLIPMPTGVTFRVVIADTGSPESSLTIRASGDIGA